MTDKLAGRLAKSPASQGIFENGNKSYGRKLPTQSSTFAAKFRSWPDECRDGVMSLEAKKTP